MNARNDGLLKDQSIDRDEPPPFMRTWNRIYAAIIIYTCALILSLYLMTIVLNPDSGLNPAPGLNH